MKNAHDIIKAAKNAPIKKVKMFEGGFDGLDPCRGNRQDCALLHIKWASFTLPRRYIFTPTLTDQVMLPNPASDARIFFVYLSSGFHVSIADNICSKIVGVLKMGLAVIGAGFGRTGTESMKTALEILGLGPCLHMKVILADPQREAYWRTVMQGEQRGDLPSWDEAYQGYQSGVDWPTAYYWRQLANYYPEAKILLTLRDVDSWYESTANTILKIIKNLSDPNSIGLSMISEGVFHGRLDVRDYAIDLYEKHNAEVRQAFPPERLLEYYLGDGWEPLCRFLERPIPEEPYPQSNASDEFHAFFDKRNSGVES